MPFSSFNGSFAGGQRASTDTFGFGRLSKSGLIVHYDAANSTSYGGSGTTFTDLTSYANHGTIVGGPTFDTNKFTWTSGDYIITPNIADHITGANTSISNASSTEPSIQAKDSLNAVMIKSAKSLENA